MVGDFAPHEPPQVTRESNVERAGYTWDSVGREERERMDGLRNRRLPDVWDHG